MGLLIFAYSNYTCEDRSEVHFKNDQHGNGGHYCDFHPVLK